MNKQSLALLEKAFTEEVNEGLHGGIGIMQSKSKLATKLLEDGYLVEASKTVGGRFPVVVKGYRLTHLGRMEYCQSCTEQSC